VAQIGARVTAADHAATRWIGRILIFGVLFVLDIDATLAGEEQAVSRGSGGQHAIHHVHAHARVLLDLVGVADSHDVARLVGGQQGQDF